MKTFELYGEEFRGANLCSIGTTFVLLRVKESLILMNYVLILENLKNWNIVIRKFTTFKSVIVKMNKCPIEAVLIFSSWGKV